MQGQDIKRIPKTFFSMEQRHYFKSSYLSKAQLMKCSYHRIYTKRNQVPWVNS